MQIYMMVFNNVPLLPDWQVSGDYQRLVYIINDY